MNFGPFHAAEQLGQGGMGEVWRGAHGVSGVPVAIKVLTGDLARRPSFQQAFRNEVRAVAGLDHPHVVRVYDHGVREDGAPWLAMELASAGTLHDGPMAWEGVREALIAVLGALAHAHARGVVHRDIKPVNVLRCGPDDARPGWKLADFGIAQALADATEVAVGSSSGTPRYMAPEQIQGRWRDQGPWTDLYALGCVTWELVTGRPPFLGSGSALRWSHLNEPPPRLAPRIAVPAGLEAWALRCLEKAPGSRFQTAADALFALSELGAAEGSASVGPDTWAAANTVTVTSIGEGEAPLTAFTPDITPLAVRVAPLPATGDGPPRTPAPDLLGAGLGLWGLRAIPLVDRGPEREALWRLLLEVEATRTPRIAVLRGPAGVGKSRLAAWVCEQAAESGAIALRATHAPVPGPADGIPAMVARHLRAERLERVEVVARAGGEFEGRALAEVAFPSGEGQDGLRLAPAERHAAVGRWLARLGRPVVVWLDDVQWGLEAVDLAAAIRDRADAPVLVVLTAREEALVERPVEAARIDGLGAVAIPVAPLAIEWRRELVQQLLGLDGALAAVVEERTAGNPLFAVQLVGDWVQRGLLEVGSGGFRVREGARVELPDDLHAVWAARIARIGAGDSLGIAATLGQEVDTAEWVEACEEAGLTPDGALVEDLLRQRLAHAEDPRIGWGFVHGMLRESVLRLAGDRAAGWNRACAAMLARRKEPGNAERRGLHLIAAGELDAAIDPMLVGATWRQFRGDFRAAERLLDAREAAMVSIALSPADDRWGHGWFRRATLLRNLGRLDDAQAWCRRAIDAAREHGWTRVLGEALATWAGVASMRGAVDPAWEALTEAEAAFRAAGHIEGMARVSVIQGEVLGAKGRFDEARERIAYTIANAGGILGAEAYRLLGHTEIRAVRPEAAEAPLAEALRRYEACGDPVGVGNCLQDLAVVAHLRGDLAAAAVGYAAAAARLRALGALADASVAELNTVVVLVRQGKVDEAAPTLARLMPELERMGRKSMLGWALLARAAIGASRGADVGADLSAAIAFLKGMVDEDAVHLGGIIVAAGGPSADIAQAFVDEQRAALRG